MSGKTDEKAEKEECEKEEEEEEYGVDWKIWTDPLEELSEIEDAFEVDSENKLHGKTILDWEQIALNLYTSLSNTNQTKS